MRSEASPFIGRVFVPAAVCVILANLRSYLFYVFMTRSLASIENTPQFPRRWAIAPQKILRGQCRLRQRRRRVFTEPAPAAPARADRASGEHRCCDKKLPIPNSSDIEAFPDFEPGKQYPVRSAPRRPIPATLARATTSAQYQWVGSQPQHSKLVKPAPKVRKYPFKCSSTTAESHPE